MPEPSTKLPAHPRAAAGPGRVLVLLYAFFTLAAGARSGVQLLTHASRAPVAYALSGVAALIYLTGTMAIARADRHAGHRGLALLLCRIELAGVLLVGTISLLLPRVFPDATVWSGFGSGYGFVPLILPVLALVWLRPTRPGAEHRDPERDDVQQRLESM